MGFKFNQIHLDKLKSIASSKKPPLEVCNPSFTIPCFCNRHKSISWTEENGQLDLYAKTLNRHLLFQVCADSNYTDLQCAIAIMAWGKQAWNNPKYFFSNFSYSEPIIKKMRQGDIDPLEAFGVFDELLRKRNKAAPVRLGIGVAYFTKLIFFCEPSHTGFIMDQWTAKSVNLLISDTESPIVSVDKKGWVDRKNTESNYENFLGCIKQLEKELGLTGQQVEIALFSSGGGKGNKGEWREYVEQHTNHKKTS